MSYSPGYGVDTTIGLDVGYKEPVTLSADRTDRIAYLVIGNRVADIRLARCHLEALRDQLPGVLADLGLLEDAEERTTEAGNRALTLAARLTDQATTAEKTSDHERAHALRGMADQLTTALTALEDALTGVETAAQAADDLTADAQRLAEERPADEQATRGEPPEAQPNGAV